VDGRTAGHRARRTGGTARRLAWLPFLAAACGPSGAPGGTTPAGSVFASTDWRNDDGPSARALQVLAERLAVAGYRPAGIEGRAFVVRRQTVTVPAPVEAGACYVSISAAAPDLGDLDSYLFQPSGTLVDQDRRRDNHPAIAWCAEASGTMYLVFEAFDGFGVFDHALFAGPAGEPLPVETLFPGEQSVPTGSDPPQPAEGVIERVRAFQGLMATRGFSQAETFPAVHLATQAAESVALEWSAGRCYTLAAFGAAGATDVDLALFAPDGERVAYDDQPALDAALQWCPVADGAFRAEMRMAGAAGDAVLARMEAPEERVGGLDGLWLGVRRPPGPTHLDLETGAARLTERIERRGYRVSGNGRIDGEAQQLAVRPHRMDLRAGLCYLFGGVGGPEVSDLDLYLYADDGGEVAADESLGATPVVPVCPERDGRFRLDVAVRGGGGAYRVLRGESAAVGAEAMRGLDTVARTRLRDVMDRVHHADLVPVAEPRTERLPARGVLDFDSTLDADACYLVLAVGSADVIDLDLVVRDPAQATVARDEQPDAMPLVRFCAAVSGVHAIDVRMVEGSGAFTLLRYRTSEEGSHR
jgi:hypothetical protein